MLQFKWQSWTKAVSYIDKFLSTSSILALALIIDQKAEFNFFSVGNLTVPKDLSDAISAPPTHWIFWSVIAVLSAIILLEDRLSHFLNKGLAFDVNPFEALDYMRIWGIVNAFRIFRDGFCIFTFGHVWAGLTVMITRLCFQCVITLCMRKAEASKVSKDLENESIIVQK